MNTHLKITIVFISLLSFFGEVRAQDSHTSNTSYPWYYPDHTVVQVAGNIGLLSVGLGYSYGKDKVTTEFLYGLVPGFGSTTTIHILTAKTSYHPVKRALGNHYLWEPIKFGTGISYSIGRQFHTTWPEQYPAGYYWWTTSFRLTPFIGTTLSRKIGNENSLIKRVELSPEIGTHDLAIISYLNNKKLPFYKILNLAIGTKFVF